MHEVPLSTLRELRARARQLLKSIPSDLTPFAKPDGTFRRTPESLSKPDDVNVTTTCSCLMALALTNSFREFYKADPKHTALTIFRSVVSAPWMSSGLTANNAFTTTLVLRTFGFLEAEGLLRQNSAKAVPVGTDPMKNWELQLGITDILSLAKHIKEHADAAAEFLWLSLSDKTRDLLRENPADTAKLRTTLVLDLARIIESGWIYEPQRFDKASAETKQRLTDLAGAPSPNAYKLAEANRLLLVDQYSDAFTKPVLRSLSDIALLMAEPDNFSCSFTINKYPPSPAVLYWFVDGITRAKIALTEKQWTALCIWATKEFNHEGSLVIAEHDAMMDPVAMGMSACLCARLRGTCGTASLGTTKNHLALLPSVVELERAVLEMISKQTRTGIWHKYFPMFHYQDAGSNYCFTFELLEATLHEFGGSENTLLKNLDFINGLGKALDWCESSYLRYSDGSAPYRGWNSGGDLDTLGKEQPESWATAVVHMFLWEVAEVLSHRIQQVVLQKYNARQPNSQQGSRNKPALDRLWDIDVLLKDRVTNLSSVLRTQIIDNYKVETEVTLRRRLVKAARSALLFGPPGTSKTEITGALADELNWPLIAITPSEFVKGTLANVYLRADEIFQDLLDLSAVVVFFDEMDALVQTRDAEIQLDIASQFLTTTMLPKLTSLHDGGRVVFFMATNFQDRFDAAIKRPGRFDLLLCMGPPKLSEKLDRLYVLYGLNGDDPQSSQAIRAGAAIKRYLRTKPELREQLSLYTFGELRAFLRQFGDKSSIGDGLEGLPAAEFQKLLKNDSKYVALKVTDLKPLRKVVNWKNLADLKAKKFTLKQLVKRKVSLNPTIRYLCDWQESKDQF
jgi:hypothetical protein